MGPCFTSDAFFTFNHNFPKKPNKRELVSFFRSRFSYQKVLNGGELQAKIFSNEDKILLVELTHHVATRDTRSVSTSCLGQPWDNKINEFAWRNKNSAFHSWERGIKPNSLVAFSSVFTGNFLTHVIPWMACTPVSCPPLPGPLHWVSMKESGNRLPQLAVAAGNITDCRIQHFKSRTVRSTVENLLTLCR